MEKKELEKTFLLQKQKMEETLGFKFETPLWELFSFAELLGPDGVQRHYESIFNDCKDNLVLLTELVLVLNLKTFTWYQVDDTIGLTYNELWEKTDAYAMDNLKGDELHYYLSTLD